MRVLIRRGRRAATTCVFPGSADCRAVIPPGVLFPTSSFVPLLSLHPPFHSTTTSPGSRISGFTFFVFLLHTQQHFSTLSILISSRYGRHNLTMEEIVPGLYLGDYPAASDLNTLTEAGITHIVIAAQECSPQFPSRFHYKFAPIEDCEGSNIEEFIEEIVEYIREVRDGHGKVLVHCMAGMSRSASLVIAFVMRQNQWGLSQTLQYVKEKRPIVAPNPSFLRKLASWEERLSGKRTRVKCGNCSVGIEVREEEVGEQGGTVDTLPCGVVEQANSLFCVICGWQLGVREAHVFHLLGSQLIATE